MNQSQFQSLVRKLAALPKETEWLEFKRNKAVPEEIGQYASALSNSAALHGESCAYAIWGLEDKTHRIVGTTFRPRQAKIGNQELENWLVTQLDPRIDVRIQEGDVDGARVVVLEIQPACERPVRFKGVEYIRIGTYKKKLHDHPEKERSLWRVFERTPFEKGVSKEEVSSDEVLTLLDYPTYFRLMKQRLPDNRAAILERLVLLRYKRSG